MFIERKKKFYIFSKIKLIFSSTFIYLLLNGHDEAYLNFVVLAFRKHEYRRWCTEAMTY